MKITIEHYGDTHMFEFANEDVPLVKVMHTLCLMLFQLGWSQEQIIECFNSSDGEQNNPFDWEV